MALRALSLPFKEVTSPSQGEAVTLRVPGGCCPWCSGISVRGSGDAAGRGAADPRCLWCCRRRETPWKVFRASLLAPVPSMVLQRSTVSPWCYHGQGSIFSCQLSCWFFLAPFAAPILPLSCLQNAGVCSAPDSRLFRAPGNSWSTEFLQINLQMFVAANSHSLLWLGAHICIALCIPSGPVSRGEMPAFLEW